MALEPDRRYNFFFSPPAHLCAVTYITEISLIVTLNNQFNPIQSRNNRIKRVAPCRYRMGVVDTGLKALEMHAISDRQHDAGLGTHKVKLPTFKFLECASG